MDKVKAGIGESSLIGPKLVQDMNDKVVLIKEKLKAVRDRQKSYADNRRKPLEFEVGDQVMLKVSPWKGVIRFGKKGKLAPSLHVPLDEIKVDKTLRFVEEPIENSDREVKSMSPPRRQRYCWNIAFATGCRRVGRRKWTNRRIRVPAFMRSCRIEEELTWVKTFGKEVEEYVTKVIAKDGTVTRFGGRFPHFIEEEEEKKPKPYNLYGFVDLMENEQVYAKTGFAPHRIPQSEGNHNGWLSEEEEADSDSESTASNCPHTV
ncbi:hypothetical protein Tco_0873418 [Tanacetum coccineum]|uniref:Reverse transcriptase domain-containing protein n=1 Tax=Tanacetum coccineum TaxID=301880 RepID=A0ABQ5BLP2_9ASTR